MIVAADLKTVGAHRLSTEKAVAARFDHSVAVALITLGCAKNEADSAQMRALLESGGYRVVDEIDDASIVIVNTCGFITEATEESLECIFDVVREWLPGADRRHVVVAGCMASRYGSDLAAELGEVSLFLGVADEERLLQLLEPLSGVKATNNAVVRKATRPSEHVKIADGCDRQCSYCTIPAIRGPYRSRPIPEIRREVESLVESGAREIVLVAQDTSCYGRDLADGTSLVSLLDEICGLEDLAWVRVMYLQPDGIDEALLDCFARNESICRYFEMPMQHSCARIVRDMGRSGEGKTFLDLVETIRRRFSEAVIRTTLIAGYPSETEEEFGALVDFLGDVRFDYVGVFPYSPEDGTKAALHDGQIDEVERVRRANVLREHAEAIAFEKVGCYVGRTLDVLVESRDKEGVVFGRHRGQAPDIDGAVMIRGWGESSLESGMIIPIRVDDAILYDLEGECAT